MSSKNKVAKNRAKREKNIPMIINFCKDSNLDYREYNAGLMIKIEGILDVYTTNLRVHWLDDNSWDSFEDYDQLARLFYNHKKSVYFY